MIEGLTFEMPFKHQKGVINLFNEKWTVYFELESPRATLAIAS
jgi:hypothetical protein